MKGFILYSTYETVEGETTIKLFGRLENGQSFVALNKFNPYFYIQKKDEKTLNTVKEPHEQSFTKLKNFAGREVLKITFKNLTDLNNSYKSLYKKADIYEADLRPQYKFLIDKNILSTMYIEGDYESSEKIDRVYKEPILRTADFKPELKILSIDTESDRKGKLYCIGLYSNNYRKNFMLTEKNLKNTISCKSESDCLEKFREEILKFDPDVITGWNVIDHDFSFLKELFRKNKIKFDIGRDNNEAKIRIESGFFKSSSMNIPGRQVLDGMNLIKDPFIKEAPSIKYAEFTSLSLEEVSQSLLKKGKLIKGRNRNLQIEKLYESNSTKSLQKLVDYNILDCQLAFEILEQIKVIDLAVERSQLVGLPLDRLSGSIAAMDSLYIREARISGLVSPTMNYQRKENRITGGFVLSTKPGIYKNVLVFDFKSLYPSIIRTFNIDPASFLKKERHGAIESPNKAYFKNTQGILPKIITRLHEAREKAKKENRELSNHAIKTIMNSFWGVLASPNCRYFNFDMANAITSFARWTVQTTAKEIEKKFNLKTIYSDTDSVFVSTDADKQKARDMALRIQDHINTFYQDYLEKKYGRQSFLELEFEKQYISMMIPQLRSKEGGAAKKRYAGLLEKAGKEKIEIVGLEAIRGDWTQAAQEFQKELLDRLFHDEPIETFIKSYIKKIKDEKMDEKLIYKKSIRKSLSEYTKTTPPHVKAARKLSSLDSNLIKYWITTHGPEPIQSRKHKLDYEHYIKKQIAPIANQILALLHKDFEDIIEGSIQSKLL